MTTSYPLIVHPTFHIRAAMVKEIARHIVLGHTNLVTALRTVAKRSGLNITDQELTDYIGLPFTVRDFEWAHSRRRNNLNRARKFGLNKHFTTFELLEIMARAGRRCEICGSNQRPLTVEHKQPMGEGGTNTADNIALTCEACNNGRDHAGDRYLRIVTGWGGWQ